MYIAMHMCISYHRISLLVVNFIVWSFTPPDLVVCISEDEEEKEENVEEEKSTRRKKPNLKKKERGEEAEELYKPSSSQTQSTRATVSKI